MALLGFIDNKFVKTEVCIWGYLESNAQNSCPIKKVFRIPNNIA